MSSPALVRPRAEHRAADLLTAYLPGSFFYASPSGTVLADGVRTVVRAPAEGRAAAVDAVLASAAADEGHRAVVAGAVGFGPESPTSLVVPAVVRRAGPQGVPPGPVGPAPAAWTLRHAEPARYEAAVRRALTMIGARELEKVVLARCLELTSDRSIPVPRLLARLVHADPTAHAFAVDVTAPGDRAVRTLVGASPELLVSRRGEQVVANPLAGSAARSADPAEDRARAAALLASEKDRREHAHVARQVAGVLGRFCPELDVPAEPELLGTATMWHLSSRIVGRLADPATSALALAEALHPTPAVCGVPMTRARAAIAELEDRPRGYYSGLVGWSDSSGDGEWVVTIRSAEVSGRDVRLFAGAGIVAGSEPVAELAETSMKFRTLLGALGIEVTA